MPEVIVVHLASASLGRWPLEVFLDSYRRCASGIEHELVVVLNGFADLGAACAAGFLEPLADVPHRAVCRYPLDIDLRIYRDLAHRLDGRFLCFLNATSEVLGDAWLATMHRYAALRDVGLVGATGSYESHRDSAKADSRAITSNLRARFAVRTKRAFPTFPNPHVRTNAFMIRGLLFTQLQDPPLRTKLDAYRLESGVHGVTAQIRRRHLRALIVGRDGRGYDVEDWPDSGTFRSGEQHNLLIADRRTREWDIASHNDRSRLASAAWGIGAAR
jgi:hypothetical protein